MPPSRPRPGSTALSRSLSILMVVVAGAGAACSSSADLDESYQRGIKAARADEWGTAMADLESFTSKACAPPKPDRRCREAYLALGRGHERRGAPASAWVSFDNALGLPPHAKDAAVREDIERAQQQLADRKRSSGDLGPVIIRYRDEVTDEYTPRTVMVSIDGEQVYLREKDAGELRSPDFTKVFGGLVAAGSHVLVVEAAHGCRPVEGVRCGASQAHQAWTFQSEAKHPVTLEVRAYAQPGEGDAPARPTLEMKMR